MECGKQIFKTQNEAIQFINYMHKRTDKRKSIKQVSSSYFCSDCKGYHVTSKDSRTSVVRPHGKTENVKSENKEKKKKAEHAKRLIIHSPINFKVK